MISILPLLIILRIYGNKSVASAFLPAGRQVLPTASSIAPNKWGRYKFFQEIWKEEH
jgi:hypothetical protein